MPENPPSRQPVQPPKQGLYDPALEHDSCGVGFLVNMKGIPSREIVQGALEICTKLDHRGGCGCDLNTGDGAGMLMQIPHKFFGTVAQELGFELPQPGHYAVGVVFLSPDAESAAEEQRVLNEAIVENGQTLLGWRDLPVDNHDLGQASADSEPAMKQVFIGRSADLEDDAAFERKLYLIRRVSTYRLGYLQGEAPHYFYILTLSSRVIGYKGMLTTDQLLHYFPDFHHPDFETSMALVHSRFSTNTFPSWPRAQPFRFMCHNGEINTVLGNENWMRSRQEQFESALFGKDLKKLKPVIAGGGSDSQHFDNCLEFLMMAGRSLPHAVMMMIPEPWEKHQSMSEAKRAFYEYHACMMEPWDGPASIAFMDGTQIGAILDRNGLRPSRFYVTSDDLVIMASEVGVLPDIDPATVVKKGRLEPGRMFLVDTREGRIVDDSELKEKIAAENPYAEWLAQNLINEDSLPAPTNPVKMLNVERLKLRQKAFGYTHEDLRFLIKPSVETGNQPLGAMGNDAPLAVLSDRPQPLYNYFKQLFAQVTNPAIDPIREELITSSVTFLGSEGNMLHPGPENCRMIKLECPIIDNEKLARIRDFRAPGFKSATLPILFDPTTDREGLSTSHQPIDEPRAVRRGKGLDEAMEQLFEMADNAIRDDVNLIILSDRGIAPHRAGIPALLAVSGLHHHLIREGVRGKVSLILESGEPREVQHFALLLGYGCDAINPFLALETVEQLVLAGEIDIDPAKARANFIKANIKGVIKTMAKMGISTVASYRGAQIFESIGLNESVIDHYFTNTPSRVDGIGIDAISAEVYQRHVSAFGQWADKQDDALDSGGVYQWRADGEKHLFSPLAIHQLQRATWNSNYDFFKEYSQTINDQSRDMFTLRGLMKFKIDPARSIPLDEVEPVEAIVKRFKTGAMSYGSISKEAHEALAIAMNRLGGKSNTGEGGEDPDRFTRDANGDLRRSAIKQVASGRFGVTSHYLVNADELQIKIVQGAKPGEGGELPGHKVLPAIAKTRGTTPGVGLISPPPHHDIYSIEDLQQLIHDLKNANVHARINVKLVSEVGVGTIAAGVAKAKADVILISGYDGGTGASPRSSIQHAGAPWELGIAETNQTLLLNDLRSRVVLEVDGQLKTGRDVAIACLLGGEEFGFATAPLVTLGCLMMRVCHKNTCPVGIATQDPRLREKFAGGAQAVVNFMTYVAQELREIMAQLGYRTINDMVGKAHRLEMREAIDHWKARGLNYAKILHRPAVGPEVGTYCSQKQDHRLERALDNTHLLEACRPAIERGEPVKAEFPIINTDRVAGTIVGSEISRRYGGEGLPPGTVQLKFTGSAGQSLGAFCPRGMMLTVEGDTNDYCGKGLSGGTIVVYPPKTAPFVAHENIITGNTAFYGATAGEAFLAGMAGERFCVRNSGVKAVIEGVGDHGCEYMTGGEVICIGKTGRNFAAGMSGGTAYVLDEIGDFVSKRLNTAMVRVYQLIECGDEEIAAVKARLERHAELTGSVRAKTILDAWDDWLPRFVKVLPADYERVLHAIARAESKGLEGDAAIQAAFEENVKAGH
ncbi:glutamate synthase large subunit [Actomonas aquatica]|uniref:Glutamate synthase large subunit n=1 Tax=Actomonas aquatica TaxID=2866162 RepID=A0ABZ1C6H5_9BACT|nr:glutamate synthase large subunit [Opitutus sp. WL0086]WRQ87250.1 glutamate synthase large subunit [Opitutus sp. WL0086]